MQSPPSCKELTANASILSITTGLRRLPLLWFVRDIENIYAEFKGRGIDVADELRQHPYGLREFAFIDINGYYIRVAEET